MPSTPRALIVLGGGIAGAHGDLRPPVYQLPVDVLLQAEVQQGDLLFHFPLGRYHVPLFGGGGLHRPPHPVGFQGFQVHRGRVVGDDAVHHALLPDDLRQGAGVDAGQAHHALFLKKGVKAAFGTEVGRSLAPLLYDISFGTDHVALKVGGNDAVIANEREGVANDLPPIAAVCQRLQITGHAGGEHHLRHHRAVGAKALALERLAVFQHKVCPFPHAFPSFLRSLRESPSRVFLTIYHTRKPPFSQAEFYILPFHQKSPSPLRDFLHPALSPGEELTNAPPWSKITPIRRN